MFFFFLPFHLNAANDSLKIMEFNSFITIVRENHPVAMQADLQKANGEATVLQAKGNFDPYISNTTGQKYFNGDKYYSLINGGLTIPTWFGIEIKAGLEQNQGLYLNPENVTPSNGLWYAGISVPIGKDLFIDKRMKEIRQAKIYREGTESQRLILLNDLLYEAGRAYWDWFLAYNKMLVLEGAVAVSEKRKIAVLSGAILGDRPFIDTLEAGIQFKNRQINLMLAEMDYQNATKFLSTFLWIDGFIPLEIDTATFPPLWEKTNSIPFNADLQLNVDSLISRHPELQLYGYKVEKLKVEKRYKQEQLKPDLNINYNAISQNVGGNPLSFYNSNNYTWGLEFSMPLFLRMERGDLQLTRIEILETEYDMDYKRQYLLYKSSFFLNEWRTMNSQVMLFTSVVQDYELLLFGEQKLFEIGESSLFMVNSREMDFINAEIKLIELLTKNQKASLSSWHALGNLNQQL